MTGLILKDENVLPERDVVLEEYNMRVANNPEARLTEQIMAALYLNHPYGRPVIGWHQEIEKLDREDALAFYRRFYAPNNAILVIAGDVDAKEVRPMVEQTFGEVAAAARDPGAAHPSAGAGAGRAAHRDAVRSARRTAEPAALLSGSLRHHRRGRRKPGARRAGAIDGQRQQLLSLSRAGGRQAARGQRRRRLSGHLARSDAVLDLGLAEARRRVLADRTGDRRRDRGRLPEPGARRGSRTRQDPAHRGGDLRPGQPGDAGALVWRRAHHRPEHRGHQKLAGPHSRRHRRTGPRRRAEMARQEAFGDRLSDQGHQRRSARRSVREQFHDLRAALCI